MNRMEHSFTPGGGGLMGALIGDAAGSPYEFANVKRRDVPLLAEGPVPWGYTDDTVQVLACADALLRCAVDWSDARFRSVLTERLRYHARKRPDRGYGRGFQRWVEAEEPTPYQSYSNGAAVRAIPAGLFARSLDEAAHVAALAASVTHDHPEGIRGAEATAAAVWMAGAHWDKPRIRAEIEKWYPLDFFLTLDELRPGFRYDDSCWGTVPPALTAFLEAESFEDALRNAVSLGGDSDSLACIAGAVAGAYYGADRAMGEKVLTRMDAELRDIAARFCEMVKGGK